MTATGVSLTPGRPLAPMQRALYTSQRLHPDAPVQNMALLTHLDGAVDPERLAASFELVVATADVLRTRIVAGDGSPRVQLDAAAQPRTIIDLPRGEAESWARARAAIPIDIAVRGYDSAILVHDDATVSWYLAMHHTITDATSSSLVFDATAAVYHGERIELASYYRWARLQTNPDDPGGQMTADPGAQWAARALDHWRNRRAGGGIDRLYQPVRRRQPTASRLDVSLDDSLAAAADHRLQSDYRLLSLDLGWSALLMTATAAYLSALSGSTELTIGLPVHNRSDAETRDLIGPVMEVFPVDIAVEPGMTFRGLHGQIGKAIMTTLANAAPGTAPGADHDAVVNVIARAGVGSFGPVPSATTWIHSGAIDSSHLLRVQYTAYDQTLALDVNHAAAGERHRRRAAGHFRSVLAAVLDDPDQLVTGPTLDESEAAELAGWESAPDFGSATPGIVDQLRSGLADRATTALSEGGNHLSGAELWDRVTGLASWLQRRGVGPGERVGIELGRSTEAVVAILATLVAGGSFVPLEPGQPERRRRRLAARAGAEIVLTALPEIDGERTVVNDRTAISTTSPDDEAYLLFTSGSTGEPKGVPITHRGLARYVRFAAERYVDPDAPPPVAPLFSSLGFDLTMTSLFVPLVTGGELVIVRPDGPTGLSEVAAETRLTWCKATPSHLEILARILPDDHRLATVVVGGEAFGAGLARRLLAARPDLAIFNEYGPTEAVVGCMIHRVDPGALDDDPEVPIGVPAPGVTLRVVGPDLGRLPIGCAGELCISHPGLTPGYLPDHVPAGVPADADEGPPGPGSPFVDLDGQRFYRSGDLVRLVDPETLVYLGRIDEQVKVGGIRLEPTEVEDAIAAHPAVRAAAVRLWSPPVTEPATRCVRCGLASNVPGVTYDAAGQCSVCHEYDRVAPQVSAWFRSERDLQAKRDVARARRRGRYDCLHLLSGGKDSTYALYRLVDLGFEPYVLTLDNGFISDEALDNVRRSVAELGLDHELATTDAMNEIFRDSLERHSNVCHGCYKTLYTLATNRAVELGIPLIVTGLSRGQLFETRLLPQQFEGDRFDPEAIDRAVVEARKAYHRLDDGPNRLLDTDVFADDELFERIQYLDFYRYVDVELAELYAYLDANAPWVRPSDTGRSTNCLINAAGIHTHLQEQGYHNYAIPYAWDVRLGHKTRAEAIAELDDRLEEPEIDRLLATVGYTPKSPETLTAWIEPVGGRTVPTPAELRAFLSESLPTHAVPRAFVTVARLPLTTNGKLDPSALPPPERTHRPSTGVQVAAETELEATIVEVWEQILRIEPIGIDDDFFALGGDSLAALEMSVALGDALDRPVPDDFAFLHSTPRDLATALEAEAVPAPTGPPLPTSSGPWSDANPPPLSPGELAILYEQGARPHDVMFNVGRLYRIGGPIDDGRFGDALRTVAATHVPLSWSYGATRRPLDPVEAVTVDATDEPIGEVELADQAERFHRAPLDLDRGPLLKAMIRPLHDGSTAVLLVCHHVSGDAESFDRLWPQLEAVYCDRPLDPVPVDYPTFTAWQVEALTDDDRRYWLEGGDDHARLAVARPGPGTEDGFVTIDCTVSPRQLKARTGASAFASGLAALVAVLRRYSDGDAVSLAMISSSRNHPVAEPLVGYFLNALPVDLPCSPGEELGELTARASAVVAGNLAHRSYPYARIVDDRRNAGKPRASLEVLVVYEKLPAATLGDLSVDQSVLSPGTAVADATFFIEERPDRIRLGLEYRGSVLDEAAATRLVTDLDTALTAVVEHPEVTVAELALPSTTASVLSGPPLDSPDSLLPAIEAHLGERSDRPAVECDGEQLSWGALGRRIDQLAGRLVDAGIGRGDRVIVHLPRSLDLVAAIVATLRVGAAYVPIDPTYPSERIELLAARSGAAAAFVTAGAQRASRLSDRDIDVGEIRFDDRVEPMAPPPAPSTVPAATDLAYLIFTSGSTGEPRGVPVTHGQLAASTAARAGVYDRGPSRFLLLSSPSFDSSIVGLFWTLTEGGTIVLPTDREAHDPDRLVEAFDRSELSHTLLVPTLYGVLLERGRHRRHWPDHVIVAGEACTASLARRHFQLREETALTNEYGPTETTVWATAHAVTADDDPVPIGPPIPGTWVAVVDRDDRPVPAGVEGELIIGGAGVVDRYDRDEEATARRFGGPVAGGLGRYFRTGDRAVVVDGEIDYLGRLDHQLNAGGVRAEPEDIERVLLGEPTVGAAVVTTNDPRTLDELVTAADRASLSRAMTEAAAAPEPATELGRLLRAADTSGHRLVAHLEPTDDRPVDLAAVRERVSAGLPPLLRPTGYGVHRALPRTPNGKVDRAAAAELAMTAGGSAVNTGRTIDPAPGRPDSTTETVDALARLFAAALRSERVEPDQSFFDLGGHSLLAMELLLEVERAFGVDVTVSSLYDHPTPAALAQLLAALDTGSEQNRFLIPIQPEGAKPPIFAIHVLGVNSAYYRPLAARLGSDQPLFGLGQPTLDLDTSMPTDVADVARLYRRELTRCAPDGPVILAAISLGAVVAYELAHQLRAEGRTVALLALFDASGPDAAEADLTSTERLAVHCRELTSDPMAYLRHQSGMLRDRIGRRSEIIAAKARDAAGLTLGDELRIRRFIEDNWRSQLTYEFRPYDGPVTVFKAADDPFGTSLARNGMGWRRVVTGQLDVVATAGGHLSLLAEPHVAELAPRLAGAADAALRAVDARAADRSDTHGTAPSPPIGPSPPAGPSELIGAAELEQELIAALHDGHLGVAVARRLDDRGSLEPGGQRLLTAADRVTRSLAAAALDEGAQAIAVLEAAGIPASLEPVPDRVQHLSIGVRIAGQATSDHWDRYRAVRVSIDALAATGYRLQDRLSPGGLAALVRSGTACTLIRTDESTTRITLRWADDRPRRPWHPGRADLGVVALPTAAWWLYYLIRPFRLASDRARGRVAGGDLGVFLGTPTAMVGDILALTDPVDTDLVVDVGCGDGRVLIEAASRFGCRGRGLEYDPDLVAEARANVAQAGLDDRVSIHEADAESVEGRSARAGATIVFLFLPAEITARLLPGLLAELQPGARVVAHEQIAMSWPVEPSLSRLVIGTGVTVAHVWRA